MTTHAAPSLALFDLDGCLIDSTPAITGALLHALRDAGVTRYEQADLTWCVGPPLFDSVTRLLTEAHADVRLVGSVVDAYRERYRETSLELTRVIPGIPEVLDGLGGNGTQLAVVTSKPAPFALPLLEGLGLRDRFAAVHAPDVDEQLETKQVTLARALDELAPSAAASGTGASGTAVSRTAASGTAPGRSPRREAPAAVMIGDRSHDVLAGRACAIRTVGVTWGAGSREELEEAGADHVVETPAGLARLLGVGAAAAAGGTGHEVSRARWGCR